MSYKPILFQTAMVQALLEGHKTMTRRIIKNGGILEAEFSRLLKNSHPKIGLQALFKDESYGEIGVKTKYQPGDILWVRETFYAYGYWRLKWSEAEKKNEWEFIDVTIKRGKTYLFAESQPPGEIKKGHNPEMGWYKRPSIFMPRAAARIFLKVTGVKVERVQDISEEDAKLEGVRTDYPIGEHSTYRSAFVTLWTKINSNWNDNPWGFVYQFERCERPADFLTTKP